MPVAKEDASEATTGYAIRELPHPVERDPVAPTPLRPRESAKRSKRGKPEPPLSIPATSSKEVGAKEAPSKKARSADGPDGSAASPGGIASIPLDTSVMMPTAAVHTNPEEDNEIASSSADNGSVKSSKRGGKNRRAPLSVVNTSAESLAEQPEAKRGKRQPPTKAAVAAAGTMAEAAPPSHDRRKNDSKPERQRGRKSTAELNTDDVAAEPESAAHSAPRTSAARRAKNAKKTAPTEVEEANPSKGNGKRSAAKAKTPAAKAPKNKPAAAKEAASAAKTAKDKTGSPTAEEVEDAGVKVKAIKDKARNRAARNTPHSANRNAKPSETVKPAQSRRSTGSRESSVAASSAPASAPLTPLMRKVGQRKRVVKTRENTCLPLSTLKLNTLLLRSLELPS